MENPVMIFKHRKWEIISIEILYFGFILLGLIFIIQGIVEKNWFYCVLGSGIVIWTILFFSTYRLEVKGYISVYSNKIVEKKKLCKEVFFKDVIEVRYFKKRIYAKQAWYMDCLQFYVKDQEVPILISPSFRGTVVPHNMTEETMAILNFIRANFPFIKYSKEEWKGTY
ncbi:hypothetical protein [Neobacillus massiliamazoniensis]|uniref:Uncharacterized protein n=1 Tax=Neobacillus massiliamazoniensis TaxID=1499688 RepID=A0A0U1P386_9BACI|nr:hypothetical protein [Neobacillus massiliamazoniensis]CRK84697.1 hypothetical protein BN000_04743 [Neobacillus massiliamazoniensis]